MAPFSARKVFLHITVIVACVSLSLANEVLPIGTILKNPESYYLHVVALAGTVRHVKVILPPPSSLPQSCGKGGGIFYSPYTFTLEDETGSIVVGRMRICGGHGLKV
ncbi:MAG TPA: hypothetical protein VE222_06310, partial [Nitrospiraceae bacterium]|nr:hypothetical protein [Nitrospiraceae bacterium]